MGELLDSLLQQEESGGTISFDDTGSVLDSLLSGPEPEVNVPSQTVNPAFGPRPVRVADIQGFQGEPRTEDVLDNAYLDIQEQVEGLVDLGGLLFDSETFLPTVKAIGENFGPAMVETFTRWKDASDNDVLLDAIRQHPVQFVQDVTFPITFLGTLGGGAVASALNIAGKGASKAAKGASLVSKWADRLGVVVDPVTGLPLAAAGSLARTLTTPKVKADLPIPDEPIPTIGEASRIEVSTKQKIQPDDSFRVTLEDQAKADELLNALEDGSILKRELVKRKGTDNFYSSGLNIKKLTGVDDIDNALNKEMDFIIQQNDGFIEQRRGEITHEKTIELAGKLGLTPEKLRQTEVGTAFSAEKLMASVNLVDEAHTDMLFKAHKAMSGGTFEKASFVESMSNFNGILNALAGAKTEAGRALNILKKTPTNDKLKLKAMEDILEIGGGDKKLTALAEKMLDAHSTPQVATLVKDGFLEKSWKVFMETWVNSLLSGPQTHVVNFNSNALVTAYTNFVESPIAATLGKVTRGEGAVWEETVARLRGISRGFARASQAGLDTGVEKGRAFGLEKLLPEHAPNILAKLGVTEIPEKFLRDNKYIGSQLELNRGAISSIRNDKVGKAINIGGGIVRTPGMALQAGDTLFKMMNYSAELEALAMRDALKKGLKNQARVDHINKLLFNPPEKMHAEAMAVADVNTFTNKLGGNWVQILGKKAQEVAREVPLMRIVVPFIRTPTNIADFALKRTPLAFTMKDVRSALKAGGRQADIAKTRIAVGIGLGAASFHMSEMGIITGGAPSNPNERKLKQAGGWQEYSYFDEKSGKYLSYNRFEPLGSIMGMAADMRPFVEHASNDELDKAAALLVSSVAKNVSSKTFLRGVTDLINAYQDPDRFAERYIQNLAGTVVPTFLASEARLEDPFLRQTNSILEKIKSRVPGQSQDLVKVPNLWGQDIKREGTGRFNPIYMRTDKKDKVTQTMIELQFFPGMPGKTIAGLELSPAQWREYVILSGERAKQELDLYANTVHWDKLRNGGPEEKVLLENDISKIITTYRRAARFEMVAKYPELLQATLTTGGR